MNEEVRKEVKESSDRMDRVREHLGDSAKLFNRLAQEFAKAMKTPKRTVTADCFALVRPTAESAMNSLWTAVGASQSDIERWSQKDVRHAADALVREARAFNDESANRFADKFEALCHTKDGKGNSFLDLINKLGHQNLQAKRTYSTIDDLAPTMDVLNQLLRMAYGVNNSLLALHISRSQRLPLAFAQNIVRGRDEAFQVELGVQQDMERRLNGLPAGTSPAVRQKFESQMQEVLRGLASYRKWMFGW